MACFGSMRLRVRIPALRPCRYGDNKPMQIYQAWAALSRRLKEYRHYAGMAEWQTHLTQNQASIPHVGSSPTSSTISRQLQQSKLDKFMSSVRIRFRAFWHRQLKWQSETLQSMLSCISCISSDGQSATLIRQRSSVRFQDARPIWCVSSVGQNASLSRWRSRVQVPYASPGPQSRLIHRGI